MKTRPEDPSAALLNAARRARDARLAAVALADRLAMFAESLRRQIADALADAADAEADAAAALALLRKGVRR